MKNQIKMLLISIIVMIICQAEYCSKVPLSNKLNIDYDLIGRWKWNNNNETRYYTISRLNSYEYIILADFRSGNEWKKENYTAFITKIDNIKFINISDKDGVFYILKITKYSDCVKLTEITEKYFKKSSSDIMEFQNSEDQTNYFKDLIYQSDFYGENIYYYKTN